MPGKANLPGNEAIAVINFGNRSYSMFGHYSFDRHKVFDPGNANFSMQAKIGSANVQQPGPHGSLMIRFIALLHIPVINPFVIGHAGR